MEHEEIVPIKTLVLDSDPETSKVISARLKERGFDSQVSSSPAQALELVLGNDFQVVLMNMQLPETSGLELAQQIREELITKPEIVFMSEDPRVSIFDCHQVGACHILKKPLNFEELFELLGRIAWTENGRRYDRVQINPSVLGKLYGSVTILGKGNFKIEVKNLGRGGFFYEVPMNIKPPEIGQVISFDLKLGMVPDYSFKGKGIVRWTRATMTESGAGVEFLSIPTDSERLVHAFVELFKVRPFVPTSF